MFKTLLATLLALFAAVAFAAVDANKATQAELEAVKGIGPVIAGKILDERKKSAFKDWQDLVVRVKGVGEGNAAKFSTEGLTVNGAAFAGAPAKPAIPAIKKEEKAVARVEEKKAAAPIAKADLKPAATSAADKKAAAPGAKADAKPAATSADEKKASKAAAAEEAKKAKADKAAARKAAKEAKHAASAASAPASAAKK